MVSGFVKPDESPFLPGMLIIRKYLLFLIIPSFLIPCGCKKSTDPGCVETNMGKISFTPQEKLIQPYRLGDSLVFFNAVQNKLATFTCTDQAFFYQNISENDPDNPWYPGCLGNYYTTEASYTKFYNSFKKTIQIWMTTGNPLDTTLRENSIRFIISVQGDSIHPFDGLYAFRADSLFNYPHFPAAHIEMYYDTINISGRLYHKVYLLKGSSAPNNIEKITQMYYSVSDGILQFSTNEGKLWSLKEKFILH